ncbi:unnamed protein product [Spirodela intermedia]|uniref:Uncharacterized protein n=2 Tax=Spirodela intermedia TaxID=51605 RepID=A0A7I8KKF9_SPIIN|nr:unnamed protein product [Spirodela intermedia]CAA6661100.1 unnamed protein product [Spirodela intermedia]CAA7397465.1 unnamed protein product [Spirodela intermedia]
MGMMGKLRMFVVQEPVVAASCLIAGFGLFLPAVVRPILDSFEAAKQVPQTAVRRGLTGYVLRVDILSMKYTIK